MKKPRLNPITGEWEVVPDDWVLTYVPQEGTYRFAPADARLVFDPISGGFAPREADARPVYNVLESRFELGTRAYVDTYNPVTGGWEMKPED